MRTLGLMPGRAKSKMSFNITATLPAALPGVYPGLKFKRAIYLRNSTARNNALTKDSLTYNAAQI